MNKYRVVYWLGSMITERYIDADTLDEVKERLKHKRIVSIEVVK